MKFPLSIAILAFGLLAWALTPEEMNAVEQFLSSTEQVGSENGPTNEEIAHDLAASLGLHNSARLLYKYSPDAHTAYNEMYDTLLFIYTGSFTTQAQKKALKPVIQYFEHTLLH
ncbi:hypothetical protein LPJ78_002123 [Coemansia sp. RSA 989]|nr:hypothetical protein BX667DRAFT_515857 [Coemansia mojavensis]KAJ1740314.1 hypothetical protein LPJ68_003869 [Coemansia sp. RSA 1086]KAJ1751566.1 hypothetical protein LPJ79_001940 [Coemansia sp. RSA 1821]KAJ1866124.1 hypothetical protein LPJ78_002123 [Coemansia sp. RSA 989]KAJ1875976.1 hypothetical protein LPJ55_000156 [Coemansia sp. RSA 990]KAJ2630675.1 hypothetical protein H4R22_002508 [Coemansia sp. RSA 1290]KAJ2652593.1 hypothetical protein IWW40_001079 [Coemansia sp. RSA 1250]KAJ26741